MLLFPVSMRAYLITGRSTGAGSASIVNYTSGALATGIVATISLNAGNIFE